MATKRFAWLRLSENAPIQQVVRQLNAALPLLPVEITTAADAAANAVPRYTNAVARFTTYTATTATFEVVATIPDAPDADPCAPVGASGLRVSVTALSNTTISAPAGYVLGTRRANSATWTVARPAVGQSATVTVESTLENAFGALDALGIADTDVLVIPAQGDDTAFKSAVRVVARVVDAASTATTLAVDVTLSGEGQVLPTTGTLSVDSWQGITGAAPASTTAALPVTVRYTIPRPAFAAKAGRVVWKGVSTSHPTALEDYDAQDVPPEDRDTVTLAPSLVQAGVTATTESYYATHGTVPAGVGTVSYATGGTATVASGAGTLVSPWVVNRPAFGSGATRLTVTASATGAASGTDAVDVTPQERDTITLPKPTVTLSNITATGFRVAFVSTAPYGATPPDINVTATAPAVITLVSNGNVGATRTQVWDVTRGAFNAGLGAVQAVASLAGTLSAATELEVPPQEDKTSTRTRTLGTSLFAEFGATSDRARLGAYLYNARASGGGSLRLWANIEAIPVGATITNVAFRCMSTGPAGGFSGSVEADVETGVALLAGPTALTVVDGTVQTLNLPLSYTVLADVPVSVVVELDPFVDNAARFYRAVVTYTTTSLDQQ